MDDKQREAMKAATKQFCDEQTVDDSSYAAFCFRSGFYATMHAHDAEKGCQWRKEIAPDGDTYYETECECAFVMIEGTPKDNSYSYCPNCGGRIIVEAGGE